MTLKGCSREKEISDLLTSGHWPHACRSELRAHVETCRACSDLILVTRTFQTSREQSTAMDRLTPPGVLWWRAQLRRKSAALERISKPVWGAHIFALSINLLIAVAFVGSQAKLGLHWFSWLESLANSSMFHFETLWSLTSTQVGWNLALVVSGLAILGILSGVILYLASDRQET
ncbi:hypothetical protein [Edaphobacter bradus]|uniref:hypothetical protein n=1 Tax=Edaphobacter bradus TaxID=2259016 RepID=UPI0021DF7697|nr:hypothetical protein [Edaphobacter bradus]